MNLSVPDDSSTLTPVPAGDSKPNIAVLLAAYNGMEYLESQVNSILTQQGVNVTIIVSIDESTDGTKEWALALSDRDRRVRVAPTPNRFGSAAANFFSVMCDVTVEEFDFVALSDQDDIWLPDKLSHAVKILQQTGCAGYSSDVWAWYVDGSVTRLKKAGKQRRWDHLFSSPGPGCTHVICGDAFAQFQQTLRERRLTLTQVHYHDWADYAFIRQRGWGWYIDPVPRMLYRQHSSNQIGAHVGLRASTTRLGALRKGWMWQQVRLICDLVDAQDTLPYRLIVRGGASSRILLAGISPLCRRRARDAVALAMSFIFASKA